MPPNNMWLHGIPKMPSGNCMLIIYIRAHQDLQRREIMENIERLMFKN
jgi:hypothetical protein